MKYYLSFCNEFGQWEDQSSGFNDLRTATFEARDLQRILAKEHKEAGAYYAIFQRDVTIDHRDQLIYKANGY